MMISPELYYDENLKGKSAEEIMHQIRSLKKDCNRLKRELELNCLEPAIAVSPNPLTMIKVYRDYLDRAKQALDESGVKYEPTILEKREISFNESLKSIKNILFYIGYVGGPNQGNEYWDISIVGDDAKCVHSSSHNIDKELSILSKEEIKKAFEDIHIGEWKRNYYNREIFEGTQWCLELEFNDSRRRIRISGSNAFPYNFEELVDFFKEIMVL